MLPSRTHCLKSFAFVQQEEEAFDYRSGGGTSLMNPGQEHGPCHPDAIWNLQKSFRNITEAVVRGSNFSVEQTANNSPVEDGPEATAGAAQRDTNKRSVLEDRGMPPSLHPYHFQIRSSSHPSNFQSGLPLLLALLPRCCSSVPV
ncbi:hypothetical protein OPV22_034880 [Ensete ventricosum]|uniref:Uncharacterized protein n=1 Tax=Ensete ventricosum TaxID=4639 RepID=A0AAV8NZT9_ENSVE|nr:hypothetical protein OPV22_034880 [Ensete ventricosum]